eukprot:1997399-Prymnesium_polylepis.1
MSSSCASSSCASSFNTLPSMPSVSVLSAAHAPFPLTTNLSSACAVWGTCTWWALKLVAPLPQCGNTTAESLASLWARRESAGSRMGNSSGSASTSKANDGGTSTAVPESGKRRGQERDVRSEPMLRHLREDRKLGSHLERKRPRAIAYPPEGAANAVPVYGMRTKVSSAGYPGNGSSPVLMEASIRVANAAPRARARAPVQANGPIE